MEPTVIVKYGSAGYFSAKQEVHNIMSKLGDLKSDEELFSPGFLIVQTKLKAHDVIENARELFLSDPELFKCTLSWIPVDCWCSVEEVPKIIKEDLSHLISADEEYAIEIIGSNTDLVDKIVPLIKGKPGYNPQKTIRIQIANNKAAVSLLKPTDFFKLQD